MKNETKNELITGGWISVYDKYPTINDDGASESVLCCGWKAFNMARQQFIEEAILRRIQVRKELESLDVLLADYDEETANLPKLK